MPPTSTPFSVPVSRQREAALQGLGQRANAGAQPQPAQPGGAPAPPALTPAAMLGDLTQVIVQDINTRGPQVAIPEFVEAFQQFIEFFQQLLAQAGGGAQAAPPGQVPPQAGPVGPPAPAAPLPPQGPAGPPLA
jgi:hypothetical protein